MEGMFEVFKVLLKRPLARYLAGIIAVGLAFVLREMLSRVAGPDFPEYVVLYPTVMIVALLAGLWPAVFTIVTTGATIIVLWLIPGHGLLSVTRPGNFVGLVLFMGVCAFLSFVAELYRRSRAKAAAYDKEQSLRESQEALRQQAELLKLSFDAIIVRRMGRGIDGRERVLEIDRDITDQKRVQEELLKAHDQLEAKVQERTSDLQKANRMLMMVSACDQALVDNSDEHELMSVICQIIQEKGGYPLVWAGLLDDAGTLRCVASAGDREGFLDGVRASGGNAALGAGLTDQVIRSGLPFVSGDIARLPEELPWRTTAIKRGFRTIAALPLLSLQKTAYGALLIYSDSLPGFEPGQVTLLKELVDDLAFGVTSLRARAERDQAQRSLELKASQLRILAGEIVRTEQKERRRIAQLLHDNLQQHLAAALYGVEGMRSPQSTEEHQESVTRLGGLLRDCIRMSRSLTSELSHPSLSEPDLCIALEWLASWMKEQQGLDVAVTTGEPITMESEETRIMLMQAVRELLFNVVKHSGVKRAHVRLSKAPDGRVLISVSDQGVGFDPEMIGSLGGDSSSIGLFSIRERLALAGGGMDVVASPGQGSRLTVWVPAYHVKAGEKKIRVLLVDDHMVARKGLALQLRQQSDIEIIGEASDGESAVRMARELRPDVVTMDVSMPRRCGKQGPWISSPRAARSTACSPPSVHAQAKGGTRRTRGDRKRQGRPSVRPVSCHKSSTRESCIC